MPKLKRTYLNCPICNRLISRNNLKKHLHSHETHPDYQKSLAKRQSVDHDGLECKYCGKLCKNKLSLSQHEVRCKKNSNHKICKGNSYALKEYVKKNGVWNKGLNKEIDPRVAKVGKTHHARHLLGLYDYSHNKHSEETKEKIRKQKLELCAKQGTNLCGKGLRGYYKGIYCQSSWELAYVIYQLDHNIVFERNKKGFKYILDGIERTYYPDFYLPESDTYVEIKGYYDRKTKEKEKQFTGNLVVYKKEEMNDIINYVTNKYGKDFVKLYNNKV